MVQNIRVQSHYDFVQKFDARRWTKITEAARKYLKVRKQAVRVIKQENTGIRVQSPPLYVSSDSDQGKLVIYALYLLPTLMNIAYRLRFYSIICF